MTRSRRHARKPRRKRGILGSETRARVPMYRQNEPLYRREGEEAEAP
jgi:hypothetical protein